MLVGSEAFAIQTVNSQEKKTGKSKGTPRGFNSVTTKARATGAVGSSSNPDTNKDILHL